MKKQSAIGSTRYAMLDHGWDRLTRLLSICGYVGPAPVSLRDYTHMMKLQSIPSNTASMETVRQAFHDLVLPESLVADAWLRHQFARSLFLTGLPGTGKTAVAERINGALQGQSGFRMQLRSTDRSFACSTLIVMKRCRRMKRQSDFDRRWVFIQRPLVVVGGELTLENAGPDLE